ncbi:hypothetical protein GIB67_004882 [Kingdonia uniflora]|uniref:Uncharacterized protein n=1 Tax=Kingdonia uniflora TaxID=39325 RepID=A0A7J7LNR9_9MAGN|nr:hypothetical protein GIB67_004882 [Kingdonia uniflora]
MQQVRGVMILMAISEGLKLAKKLSFKSLWVLSDSSWDSGDASEMHDEEPANCSSVFTSEKEVARERIALCTWEHSPKENILLYPIIIASFNKFLRTGFIANFIVIRFHCLCVLYIYDIGSNYTHDELAAFTQKRRQM